MTTPVRYGGCPLWARVILLTSLTINLVIVGLVIGERLRPVETVEGSWMLSFVPAEKKQPARELFAKRQPKIVELREGRRQVRLDMMQAMKAETFEADAMAALLEKHRVIANEQRALIHAQLIELFGMLTHAEREMAAVQMQQLYTGRPRRPK
ncbi:MAG: hypothetical protein AAF317_04200 [Pseudomonadota bacterium]